MGLDDRGRDPDDGPAELRPVVGLEGEGLGLAVVVRDGALARGLAGLLVVVEPDAGLLGDAVDLDLADGGEVLADLRDLDVLGQVLDEDLDLGVDPRVVGPVLGEFGHGFRIVTLDQRERERG